MPKMKRKVTKKSIEAGTMNLLKHRPKCPNLRHGLQSATVHARFEDGRTREARQLKAKMDGLIEEAGGISRLSLAMWSYLSRIKDVLKIVIIAENWIGRQPIDSLIKNGGLNRVFEKFLAAQRRSHKLVTEFRALIPKDRTTDYQKAMKELQE